MSDFSPDLTWLKGQRSTRPSLEAAFLKYWPEPEEVFELLGPETGGGSHNDKPHGYASESLMCHRKIGLRVLGRYLGHKGLQIERQISTQGLIALSVGSQIHRQIQATMMKSPAYKDFQAEVYWDLDTTSGYADGFYTLEDGTRVVMEAKTKNHWSFKKAVRDDAPYPSNILQGQLSAYALEADEVHLIYIDKAASGKENPIAEWFFPFDREAAANELNAQREIVHGAQDGIIPARMFQGDEIEDPEATKWPCAYCDFQPICVTLGQGEKTTDDLP